MVVDNDIAVFGTIGPYQRFEDEEGEYLICGRAALCIEPVLKY